MTPSARYQLYAREMIMSIKQLLTSANSHHWHSDLAALLSHAESAQYPAELEIFLRKIISFTGIAIITYKGKHAPLLIHDSYTSEERLYKINAYIDGAYLLDPFFKAIKKGLPQGVYQLTEFTPDRFEYTHYYQHYFKISGLKNELGISIELEKDVVMFISLGFSKATPIQLIDMTALANILPLLSHATQRFWLAQKDHYTLWETPLDPISRAFDLFGKDQLTQREQEIVALILQGHSSKSAARELNISDSTIKVHRKNIYARLGISTQAQLFSLFLNHLLSDWSSSRQSYFKALRHNA